MASYSCSSVVIVHVPLVAMDGRAERKEKAKKASSVCRSEHWLRRLQEVNNMGTGGGGKVSERKSCLRSRGENDEWAEGKNGKEEREMGEQSHSFSEDNVEKGRKGERVEEGRREKKRRFVLPKFPSRLDFTG